MPTYKRPGSYVSESLNQINTVTGDGASVAAFVAPNGRGPTTPTRVESWTQFVKLFGGFDTANGSVRLPHAVFSYFANGGRVVYPVRALGTGAAKATRTLQDRDGAPANTLDVEAINEGAWGNSVYIDIVDFDDNSGTPVPGRFDLHVYEGGVTASDQVERFTNLAIGGDRDAVGIVNRLSNYVRLTDLGSATAAPDNIPALQSGVALAGGANGAAPVAGDLQTAWETLDVVEEPIDLNLPGEVIEAAITAAQAYAEARGDVFLVVDPLEDMSPDTTVDTGVIDFAQGLSATSYSALYYPFITVADPSSSVRNASRLTAPGGAVVGQYARTDSLRGFHKAPAGINNRIAGAVALERSLTNTELDNLNEAGVNAIRQVPGSGICVFGARTMKRGDAALYVPVRRTLIQIKHVLKQSTRFAIFEPNDEALWFSLTQVTEQYLRGLWQRGALRGGSQDEAFYVKCDEEINTQEVIDAGQVLLEVGVALQTPAEFVVITVGQYEGGSSASEL